MKRRTPTIHKLIRDCEQGTWCYYIALLLHYVSPEIQQPLLAEKRHGPSCPPQPAPDYPNPNKNIECFQIKRFMHRLTSTLRFKNCREDIPLKYKQAF